MSAAAIIRAEHVELMLVARRIAERRREYGEQACRWAAMSDHVDTQDCDGRRSAWRVPHGPLLSPMNAGRIDRAIERVRLQDGTHGVVEAFGQGIRAMRQGTASGVMR